ncbi:hypothetical protein, partial [Novosphingobium sp. TCA1]|uniref:hypothetical protein n=1 Tax=Novosphingobium sp. TCA1 TaxID=2682474 RepID=UPI001F183431
AILESAMPLQGKLLFPQPVKAQVAREEAALKAAVKSSDGGGVEEVASSAGVSAAKPTIVPVPNQITSSSDLSALTNAVASNNSQVKVTETKDEAGKPMKITEITPVSLAENNSGRQKFGGIDFGVGMAFTYNFGYDRLEDASLDENGVVRVNKESNASARIFLETHYLFTPDGVPLGGLLGGNIENIPDKKDFSGQILSEGPKRWGFGPFIAVQPSSNNIIDAIGAGIMLGLRRPVKSNPSNDSFNIGIGGLVDISAKTLGNGIKEDQLLPAGETAIRYKTRPIFSLMLLSSYSF